MFKKTRLFRSGGNKSHSLFFQNLDLYHKTDIYLVEYGITCDFPRKKLLCRQKDDVFAF